MVRLWLYLGMEASTRTNRDSELRVQRFAIEINRIHTLQLAWFVLSPSPVRHAMVDTASRSSRLAQQHQTFQRRRHIQRTVVVEIAQVRVGAFFQ